MWLRFIGVISTIKTVTTFCDHLFLIEAKTTVMLLLYEPDSTLTEKTKRRKIDQRLQGEHW